MPAAIARASRRRSASERASPSIDWKLKSWADIGRASSAVAAIAAAAAEHGADLAFTYQMEGFGKRLRPLAESVGSDLMVECDVAHEGAVATAFDWLTGHWSSIDFVVHALAFSDKDELKDFCAALFHYEEELE